ncbi:MAG: glycosyltransferase [Patescibacteria group bacterium]
MNKKILILHDRFKFKGGAERLVLIMAQALNADIATEYWNDKESFAKNEASSFAPARAGATADKPRKIIVLGKQVTHVGLSYFSAQWRFFWRTKFIKNYDVIIFSGNNCLSAAWRARGKHKIMYCHTPVRYAYDLKDYYLQQKPVWQKPLFFVFVYLARAIYQWGIKKMDLVLANSKNVQARLKFYCGVKSEVLYPPIDTDKFQHYCHSRAGGNPASAREIRDPRLRGDDKEGMEMTKEKNNYYLSFGRLDPLKRIDDIVRAFHLMPDKKLIVASGGPELTKIKQLAVGHDNIKILGFVDDKKLAELVGGCLANIYIPKQEDFGMTPLEAAAAGKPTIGVDDGGLRETIIHQKTGYLIPKNYTIENLIKAVQWLNADRAAGMNMECKKQAERFSKERFAKEIKHFCY